MRIAAISVLTALFFLAPFAASGASVPSSTELDIFEAAHILSLPQTGQAHVSEFGWKVVQRNQQGRVVKAELAVLVDNPGYDGQIFVVGPFNNWGKSPRSQDALHPIPGKTQIFSAVVDGLSDGMPYRISLNGHQILDPSAPMFTTPGFLTRSSEIQQGTSLNSVFYDIHDPSHYQTQTEFIDISARPNLISEVELHSLIAKFRAANGQLGPRMTAETYRFVAESGVVAKLKDAGYTAVEMLPLNQSIDGDAWNLRYQIYGLFAPDSHYGNPSEFKMMVDEFHKNGIAVIMDSVISHFPYKGNTGERALDGIGLDQWFKADGSKLFVGPLSPWGTYRYDYSNPYVRRFLIDSVQFMMSEYKVDGIRVDNADGIVTTQGGVDFLRELVVGIRQVNPRALVIAEAFFPPSTLLHRTDQGGFGFNTRNNSNLFELWKKSLQGPTEDIDLSVIGGLLRSVFDWREVPMLSYLSNHDEAANGRGGLTGAYPASLLGGDAYYAFSKTKAADAYNMLSGAYHISIPQAHMMQTGTFYSNPEIDWSLTTLGGRSQQLWDVFSALAKYIQARPGYFNFASLSRDIENHIDNVNKVISLKRRDPLTGKVLYALINLGHLRIADYAFGIERQSSFRLLFDSERIEFGGSQELTNQLSRKLISTLPLGEHGKPFSLRVPVVAPYSVSIFEEQ
jgi:1,4-alpha-glucan branching enzyme